MLLRSHLSDVVVFLSVYLLCIVVFYVNKVRENKKKMKRYKLNVRYVFSGVFEIDADSFEEAQIYFHQHCGCTIGDVHSSLPDEEVDWEFDVHPTEKNVKDIEYLSPRKVVRDILKEHEYELPLNYDDFMDILTEFVGIKDMADIIGGVYLNTLYSDVSEMSEMNRLVECLAELGLHLQEELTSYY